MFPKIVLLTGLAVSVCMTGYAAAGAGAERSLDTLQLKSDAGAKSRYVFYFSGSEVLVCPQLGAIHSAGFQNARKRFERSRANDYLKEYGNTINRLGYSLTLNEEVRRYAKDAFYAALHTLRRFAGLEFECSLSLQIKLYNLLVDHAKVLASAFGASVEPALNGWQSLQSFQVDKSSTECTPAERERLERCRADFTLACRQEDGLMTLEQLELFKNATSTVNREEGWRISISARSMFIDMLKPFLLGLAFVMRDFTDELLSKPFTHPEEERPSKRATIRD